MQGIGLELESLVDLDNKTDIKYIILTRPVAVYLETLQCRLEESFFHRRTRQVTQLFTYSTDAQAV